MAFSRLYSSLKSLNKASLRNSLFHSQNPQFHITNRLSSSYNEHKPDISWLSSLVPVAIAISAGSFAFQTLDNPALCDASSQHPQSGVNYGGKGSTDYVVKGHHRNVPQQLILELKDICQDNMSLDYNERDFHGKPQNSFHKAVNIPDVVVYPRSEEEVSKIVKSCNKYKVPIIPYGGATSIEGHTLSPNGGVCIDMTLMNV